MSTVTAQTAIGPAATSHGLTNAGRGAADPIR